MAYLSDREKRERAEAIQKQKDEQRHRDAYFKMLAVQRRYEEEHPELERNRQAEAELLRRKKFASDTNGDSDAMGGIIGLFLCIPLCIGFILGLSINWDIRVVTVSIWMIVIVLSFFTVSLKSRGVWDIQKSNVAIIIGILASLALLINLGWWGATIAR